MYLMLLIHNCIGSWLRAKCLEKRLCKAAVLVEARMEVAGSRTCDALSNELSRRVAIVAILHSETLKPLKTASRKCGSLGSVHRAKNRCLVAWHNKRVHANSLQSV